jgi:hypothetical protein
LLTTVTSSPAATVISFVPNELDPVIVTVAAPEPSSLALALAAALSLVAELSLATAVAVAADGVLLVPLGVQAAAMSSRPSIAEMAGNRLERRSAMCALTAEVD